MNNFHWIEFFIHYWKYFHYNYKIRFMNDCKIFHCNFFSKTRNTKSNLKVFTVHATIIFGEILLVTWLYHKYQVAFKRESQDSSGTPKLEISPICFCLNVLLKPQTYTPFYQNLNYWLILVFDTFWNKNIFKNNYFLYTIFFSNKKYNQAKKITFNFLTFKSLSSLKSSTFRRKFVKCKPSKSQKLIIWEKIKLSKVLNPWLKIGANFRVSKKIQTIGKVFFL